MTILLFYILIGCITVLYYQKNFEITFSFQEMLFLWPLHIRNLIISRTEYLKKQKEHARRKAVVWSEAFFEANKTAFEEKWDQKDWDKWHDNIEYTMSLIQ